MVRAYEASLAAVRSARQFVADHAPAAFADDARLATSELATNSVIHARSPFTVRLVVSSSMLRVEVADTSPDQPVLRRPGVDDVGGRGLAVVAALTSRWGSRREPEGGKVVWFEFDL